MPVVLAQTQSVCPPSRRCGIFSDPHEKVDGDAVSGRRRYGRRRRRVAPVFVVALLACAAVGWGLWSLSSASLGWRPLLIYLFLVNFVTLAAYAYDKSAAGRGRGANRIPEMTLHLLALAGGTPAAMVARVMFRHKTIDGPFRVRFWLIAVLQLIAVGVWLYLRRR